MDATHGRGVRAEAVVARLAARQHGVFSRRQALDAGFSARMISHRLDLGRWYAVEKAVYMTASTPTGWELVVMAACVDGPAFASHRASARIWHSPIFGAALPEVSAFRHRRRRSTAVRWHESRYLEVGRDTTVVDGIPVTTMTRTILDLSLVATTDEIEIVLDDATNRGLTSPERVEAEMHRLGRHNGNGNIRTVLDRKVRPVRIGRPAHIESPLESRVAIMLRGTGLPEATPQFEVFDVDGLAGRVDFAWPAHCVALEVDGFAFHGDRGSWERDRLRQTRLATAGWRVLHVTHGSLGDPASLIAQLRRSVGVQ